MNAIETDNPAFATTDKGEYVEISFTTRPNFNNPRDEFWRVEVVTPGDEAFYPMAVAYVNRYSKNGLIVLQLVVTPEHLRRKGYAKVLLRACQQRWPTIDLGDAITPEGAALLKTMHGVN